MIEINFTLYNIQAIQEIVYSTLFLLGLFLIISIEFIPKIKKGFSLFTFLLLYDKEYLLKKIMILSLITLIVFSLIFSLFLSGENTWTGSNPWDPILIDDTIGGLAESSTNTLTYNSIQNPVPALGGIGQEGSSSNNKIDVDLKIRIEKGGGVYLYDHLHSNGETINRLYPNDELVKFEARAKSRGQFVSKVHKGIQLPNEVVKDTKIRASGYWIKASYNENYNITSNGRPIVVSEDRTKFFVVWKPWPSFKG